MKPHVKTVILELLNIIRETENDDLTGTMQRLVCLYVAEVTPIAIEMMSHLVSCLCLISRFWGLEPEFYVKFPDDCRLYPPPPTVEVGRITVPCTSCLIISGRWHTLLKTFKMECEDLIVYERL